MTAYTEMDALLTENKDILARVEEYKGCADLARKAMSAPTKEHELAAFVGLLAAVDHIAAFYNYTKQLEVALPRLWTALCDSKESKSTLQDQQALAKQLADIFDFALRFDQTRMMRPNLSNDFSYYRRLLPKFNKHRDIKVKDEEASGMALFTADHIPMMSCISKATQKYAEDHGSEGVRKVLTVMANSCLKMIKTRKFAKNGTSLYCARAMTGAIVLYDLIIPDPGVFGKKCAIQLKNCILLLRKDFPKEGGLLNAIRYSTRHFSKAPESIESLFPD